MNATSRLRTDHLEDGAVLRIVLDHPKGNVLDGALMTQLDASLEEARDESGLKMVLLRGAGGSFSYGASVEEHRRETVAEMLGTFHRLVRHMGHYPVPLVALVEGRCLGGGFELVLACHVVFSAPNAIFACPEIQLGVFPPVLAAVGALRLGGARSERMLLTGESLSAEEATKLGFALPISDPEDAEEEVLAWYRKRLAPLSAASLRLATRASREGSGLTEAFGAGLDRCERLYLDELVTTHDANEGIEAFIEKRRPVWQNR